MASEKLTGIREDVANVIRTGRNNAGLSQVELAEKMKLHRSAVALWERARSLPRIEHMPILEEILDIDLYGVVKSHVL